MLQSDEVAMQILWGTRIIFAKQEILIYPIDWQINQLGMGHQELDNRSVTSLYIRYERAGGRSERIELYSVLFTVSQPILLDDAVRYTFLTESHLFGLHIPRDLDLGVGYFVFRDAPSAISSPVGLGHLRCVTLRHESVVVVSCLPELWEGYLSRRPLPTQIRTQKEWNVSWQPAEGRNGVYRSIGFCEELGPWLLHLGLSIL
jgi:hypothetical protein